MRLYFFACAFFVAVVYESGVYAEYDFDVVAVNFRGYAALVQNGGKHGKLFQIFRNISQKEIAVEMAFHELNFDVRNIAVESTLCARQDIVACRKYTFFFFFRISERDYKKRFIYDELCVSKLKTFVFVVGNFVEFFVKCLQSAHPPFV